MRSAIILMATFLLSGCGNSPLFHHRNASGDGELTNGTNRSACPLSFPNAGLCASVDWVTKPGENETGVLSLHFWQAQGGSANGPFTAPAQTVAVKLLMPSMGHGSSPVTVTPDSVPGTYRASGVYFVMPGAWEIWVQLKNGSTVVEQAKLDYQA